MSEGTWNPMSQQYEPETLTLADFLLARIAEDAADAFAAIGCHWGASEYRRVRTGNEDDPRRTTVVSSGGVDEHWEPPRPSDPGTDVQAHRPPRPSPRPRRV